MKRGKWMVAVFLLLSAGLSAAEYHLPSVEVVCSVNGHAFRVHVAATRAERAQGFSGASPALIERSAILFIYPESDFPDNFNFGGGATKSGWKVVDWYFNMRHMTAPLDIAFMDSHGRIFAVLRMTPGHKLYRPVQPYAAALELTAGRATELNLEPGAMLKCHAKVNKGNDS